MEARFIAREEEGVVPMKARKLLECILALSVEVWNGVWLDWVPCRD